MSGKTNIRGNRLETEIERSREESNWKKVIELAEHLKARNQPGLGKLILEKSGRCRAVLPSIITASFFSINLDKLQLDDYIYRLSSDLC